MPNTYAARRFREGKFTALSHLMRVLEAEELPRERGHSFKAGQVEKYLGLESPLQPRTLLTVLRDAKVPHDNNCRFLPWMIYDYLPAFRKLHREYRSDLGMKLPQAKQETGPGAEETGNLEEETGQEGGEVRGDEAAAETRSGPPETRDKPEVEPGQGAVAGPDRKDRVSVTFEGISILGERIVRLSYPGRSIRTYAVDMGSNSAGRRRYKRIGHERPPLLSTMERPTSPKTGRAEGKDVQGRRVKSRPEPVANPSRKPPERPKRPGVNW